ncbi:TPA: type IV toxin-antitoxin system YeeU family antitoxin [Salmonella enterica]|uniref:type IV toxin-antitoxin system YeeU family antitoxin n=1 Tax=Salmonella enterica TaxID=28901 RepID=UPI00387EB1E2
MAASIQNTCCACVAPGKSPKSALKSGALDPRQPNRHSITLNGLTCEADTNVSHGYVYLTIYPAE